MNLRSLLLSVCLMLIAACATSAAPKPRLYDELGGHPGIEALVETLLYRVSDDARISHHFVDVNIINLNDRLVEQICVLADGPCAYHGKNMAEAHRFVEVSEADFNAMVENLMWAMDRQKLPRTTQNRLLKRLAALQTQIVRRVDPADAYR